MMSRRAVALFLALLVGQQAQAKEFRHYYGLQWEFEAGVPTASVEVKEGDVVATTRLLPTALFVLDGDFVANGRTIIAKGTQLAPAVSSQAIRCTLGPGAAGSLSEDRRVCLVDLNRDNLFDGYFDEGLGMEMAQLQFTGCMPVNPAKAMAPSMTEIHPRETRWPFTFTVSMTRMKTKPGHLAQYEFAVVVKRGDKPALRFTLCRSVGDCRVVDKEIINAKGGVVFRAVALDPERARVEFLRPFDRTGFYDMSAANRPDPVYCPGTLFVKTDQHDFPYP